MEFQTLRKSHKKQIIIGALAICVIGGAITFATSRAFYKVSGSVDLAKGTVNYKAYDFKIMAMYKSDDGSNYTEITDRMPSSGYVINEEKSYCTIDNKTHDTNAVLKTIDGNHVFNNLAKSDKCYLYFDKYVPPITIPDIIAANNPKTTTPTTFESGTTTDEGVYSVSDPVYGGTSYYWRGLVTNNYVTFAGKCWRIVRINGDGSIRLIYDGTTCHANGSNSDSIITRIAYNTSYDQSNYVGWTYSGTSQRALSGTASNAKSQLESWYSLNITGTNATKVADGKYCNDRNVDIPPSSFNWGSTYTTTWNTDTGNSDRFAYAGAKRIYTDYSPSLACNSGDVYTLKVGLITADEVMYAGGTDKKQTLYYIYNRQHYWTMSPCVWYGNSVNVFHVSTDGSLSNNNVSNTRGLRPVINLKSDVLFSSGDGTLNNPYVVE